MHFFRGVPALVAIATLSRLALADPTATPSATPATTPEVEDKLAAFKTADELWGHFLALQKGPRTGSTPEERERAYKDFVTELHTTAERFARSYPTDPRRWEARVTAARLVQKIKGKSQADVEKLYRKAAVAPDAPAEVKMRVRLGLIHMHREALKEDSSVEQIAALETEIAAFAADFPAHASLPRLLTSRADLWQPREPAKAVAILTELTKHENPGVVKDAEACLRLRNIKDQPLALSFTAIDGRDVDVQKLRGKVVLVDFWSASTKQYVDRLPELIATHDRLQAQGLEIVGICLDKAHEKQRLLTMIEEKKIMWPQHFDGKGMKNEVGSHFAIRQVPARWIVNKQGYVVFTTEQENLEELVKKLLAE